jgi:hypothetical protein
MRVCCASANVAAMTYPVVLLADEMLDPMYKEGNRLRVPLGRWVRRPCSWVLVS